MSLVERMTAVGRRDQLEQYVEVRILPVHLNLINAGCYF